MTVAEESSRVYEELLTRHQAAEEQRKTSLEQRGGALITTSGALVTLLFGLSAYVPQEARFPVGSGARTALLVAAGFLLLAAVLALTSTAPLPYGRLRVEDLDLRTLTAEPAEKARQRVLLTTARLLEGTQRLNAVKAALVLAATLAEVLAAASIATSLALLFHRT